MYYGPQSSELLKLRKEYEKLFGYDPNGDVEIEISAHDEYAELLNKCISEKRDMFDVLDI